MAWRLTVMTGEQEGESYRLRPEINNVVGRAVEDTTIQIRDRSVSRPHCLIRWIEGGWVIEDLGSTNGTCVNGHSVSECLLKSGDVVQVGRVEVRIVEYPEGAKGETTAFMDKK